MYCIPKEMFQNLFNTMRIRQNQATDTQLSGPCLSNQQAFKTKTKLNCKNRKYFPEFTKLHHKMFRFDKEAKRRQILSES